MCEHPLILDGMSLALSSRDVYSVVGRTGWTPDITNLATVHRPEVVVLGLGASDRTIDTIPAITRLPGNPKVVVFNAFIDVEHAMRALDAGATGYLTLESTSDELVECVRTVLSGDTYITPSIATKLVASLRAKALRKAATQRMRLTTREEQIVGLLHKGKTNREIAEALELSEKTVKHYMTVLMHKLAARSRLEVILALKKSETTSASSISRTFN